MRFSRLLGTTLREVPTDVRADSYRLLLRGGYIRPLGAGLFSFLPLGHRVIRRLKRIIAEEMEKLGGQEVSVAMVNPYDLWERSGRAELAGKDLIEFQDRTGRRLVLSPTHEEAMVELVRTSINSYRDLPVFLYQFQTKFRDENRPGHGLLRTKEFVMKDAYSFHRSFTDLNNFFPTVFATYHEIFERCGVPVRAAEAGVGYMGGDKSFEFVVPSDWGDDHLTSCPSCGYSANAEVAVAAREIDGAPPRKLEPVSAPGCNNMVKAAAHLEVPQSRLVKSLVFRGRRGLIMVCVRGDHSVSLEKLATVADAPIYGLADRSIFDTAGVPPGFVSPVGMQDRLLGNEPVEIVVDSAVAEASNLIIGGNEPNVYLRNANFGRDYDADRVGDIARIPPGSTCRNCGATLEEQQVLELGHIFRLGTTYSDALGLSFRGDMDEEMRPFMGSYGIGLGRLLAAIVESNNDEKGIIWPEEIAPFRFYLMSIGRSLEVRRLSYEVYDQLEGEVLIDDRHESVSSKFADAQLLGLPYRIVVSAESLINDTVEVHSRRTGETWTIPIAELDSLKAHAGAEQ
ncbi:MAG: proline--tRNA ligase [Spirochaetes bacterium]|jgi:prolyl-tRNA synthetase|nr:proline--tRNA ligase [Spirochaetota bacterium]